MRVGPDTVLFLGAGISAPLPARAPMFAEIRDACAERVGVRPLDWPERDPRRALLRHVIPEVFLKVLADAGFHLEQALAAVVVGGIGSEPNAGHRLAARVIYAGGMVWTTNWDPWIEDAYASLYGTPLVAAVSGADRPPVGPGLGKLHGTVFDHRTLMFRSSQVIRPLARDWHDALVSSARGRQLFVAGYAGADVDLFPALNEASRVAEACYWFEGAGDRLFEDDPLAAYERWRFGLDSRQDDPTNLPASGRHLVWCGAGSTASDPSRGLLDALEDTSPSGQPAPWEQRYDAVKRQIEGVRPTGADLGRSLLVRAIVRERLADRRGAALRYMGALSVGRSRERIKALRSLRNLIVLRSARLRAMAVGAYSVVKLSGDDAEFLRRHAGDVSHDAERAARVAQGEDRVTIDGALNLALETRWSGDLTVAETIARTALNAAMTQDLESTERDWPERVSRASYELAQSLLWQGRYLAADDVCRTGLMRVSGAKWTAWEFSIRAAVRYVHADYSYADEHFAECERILEAEGFADFAVTVATGRSAACRGLGDIDSARVHFTRAERWPRKGQGSVAAVLAEGAELDWIQGDPAAAVTRWRTLTQSPLPLWKGLAHMRLAEVGHEQALNSDLALKSFQRASSEWGRIRATALRDGEDVKQVAAKVPGLGPVEVYLPGGRWLI